MPDPAPVACVIYDSNWTKEIDDRFIYYLEFKACQEKRALTADDHKILADTVRMMNNAERTRFDYYDIYMRFQLAHKRFVTWDWIINYENISYNPNTNTVEGTPADWQYIAQLHKLGSLYMNGRNEHMWTELKAIFGPPSARTLEFDQPLLRPKDQTARNLSIRVDKLLRDIRAGESSIAEKTEVKSGCSVCPPDVMSTTKGKGELLYNGPSPKVSLEMNTRSISARTSKASCSTAKRSINF